MVFIIISQTRSAPINKQTAIKKTEQPVKAVSVKEDKPVVVQEQTVTPVLTAVKPACDAYDDLLARHFGDDIRIAKAVMRAESGCRADAVGDGHITYVQNGTTYGMSCGLFQIRFLPGRPNCEQMKNPSENIAYAGQLYHSQGFRPWSAFLNQSYLKFIK